MIRRFARPYAKALMDVTGSPAQGREVHQELTQFESMRASSEELQTLLVSPAVDSSAKLDIVRRLAGRMSFSPVALRILEVLLRNHRLNDLGSVLDAWRESMNRAEGVAVASVRTAHVLDDAERARLQASLEKKLGQKVEVELTVDPALLGGFVATVGSEVWDASVVGRIHKLRQAIQ